MARVQHVPTALWMKGFGPIVMPAVVWMGYLLQCFLVIVTLRLALSVASSAPQVTIHMFVCIIRLSDHILYDACGLGYTPSDVQLRTCGGSPAAFPTLDECVLNICTCTNGTAALASDGSCTTDGEEICGSCNPGFSLNGQVCTGLSVVFGFS